MRPPLSFSQEARRHVPRPPIEFVSPPLRMSTITVTSTTPMNIKWGFTQLIYTKVVAVLSAGSDCAQAWLRDLENSKGDGLPVFGDMQGA
ncbi:hypothetical protein V6N11_043040 [Hibiscus sabdariffa]|uniref:Uncharacterized protein n=1 Tax=Hibiscus sabdariffa TaxID=183260 RepID=A0ABR2QY80_9ROSI